MAAIAVTALTLLAGGTAFADDVVVDGDEATMATTDLILTGCDLPATRAGLVKVTKSDKGQHFDAGETLSLTITSQDPRVTAQQMGPAVTVPTTWNTGTSFTIPISTTIAADAPASGDFKVFVDVVGVKSRYKANNASYRVKWTNCSGNSAPVVTIAGVANGDTYEFGSLPAATCRWTDDHDGQGTVTPSITGPADGAKLGQQTVSCSQTDSGGLTGSASATYRIVDTTAPALTDVQDVQADAENAAGAVVGYIPPTAHDLVDGDRDVSCSPASGATFPLGNTTVTCYATDLSGHRGSTFFTVTVADKAAPVVSVPTDETVEATGPDGAAYTFAATAQDNVDGALEATCSPASGDMFALGATSVTCTATDNAGNEGTASFTLTVQDKSAPVITVPEPEAVEATGPDGAVVTWNGPTAHDVVEGDLSVTCDHTSGGTFSVDDTTVTCTAEDSRGNKGSATFVVRVTDTTAPELSVPAGITAEATSPNGAVVSYAASATDIVDGNVAVTCTPASGTQFALDQATPVMCSASDERGNTASGGFMVAVVDTTAPAMPALNDVAAEASSADGAVVSYSTGMASDAVDGDVAVVCQPESGATFPLGSTTVTCTATDSRGNKADGSFAVTVRDTTPPVFAPISVPTTEATGPGGAEVAFDPTATDAVDANPVISCDPASGSWFALGATQVTCTATDASGNVADTEFSVNVADTTAPVVEAGVNQTVEATSAAGAVVSWKPLTAHDTVAGDLPVSCDWASGTTFPLAVTVVTCSAADGSNNTGVARFTITVEDTTAPSFSTTPTLTVTATSAAGAVVAYTAPAATDLVSGTTPVTCDKPSGSTFPLGTTTVVCSSTDEAGNTGHASFTVTVAVAWSGVLAPLTNGGSYKLGSTIPVKFALTGASSSVTNLKATLWVRKTPATSGAGAAEAVSTSAATAGNLFRYSDGQYIFNLNTKPLSVGTYELRIDLGDGVAHMVVVTLR